MHPRYKLNLSTIPKDKKRLLMERYVVHAPYQCTPQLLHRKNLRPAGYKWGSLAGLWIKINGSMYTVDSVIEAILQEMKLQEMGIAQVRVQTDGPRNLRGPALMYLIHPSVLTERFRVRQGNNTAILWHRPGIVYSSPTQVESARVVINGVLYRTIDVIELMKYYEKYPEYWETGALKTYWDAVNLNN